MTVTPPLEQLKVDLPPLQAPRPGSSAPPPGRSNRRPLSPGTTTIIVVAALTGLVVGLLERYLEHTSQANPDKPTPSAPAPGS